MKNAIYSIVKGAKYNRVNVNIFKYAYMIVKTQLGHSINHTITSKRKPQENMNTKDISNNHNIVKALSEMIYGQF